MRRVGREKAELAKVGPGAVDFVELMDRTASFLLAQLPTAVRSEISPSDRPALSYRAASGAGGRLAAPVAGLPEPGVPVLFTYGITSKLFNDLISQLPGDAPGELGARPPGTITADLGGPTTDDVTVGGNKGKITTTVTVSATKSVSRISLLVRTKVSGEVRDPAGLVIYSVDNEFTGVATGDVCPEASGVARAKFGFHGREEYTSNGVKSGQGLIEGFSSDIQFKVDDDAKLSAVELTTAGADVLEGELLRMAASSAAPLFEKAWRSGMCIAVVVDPDGGEVERDSVTSVTAKVKHKIDGNELNVPVEAELFQGPRSITPSGEKQNAPATFKYTAGSKDDERGSLTFESVSNRGIGSRHLGFTVRPVVTLDPCALLRSEDVQPLVGGVAGKRVGSPPGSCVYPLGRVGGVSLTVLSGINGKSQFVQMQKAPGAVSVSGVGDQAVYVEGLGELWFVKGDLSLSIKAIGLTQHLNRPVTLDDLRPLALKVLERV